MVYYITFKERIDCPHCSGTERGELPNTQLKEEDRNTQEYQHEDIRHNERSYEQ